MSSRLLRALPLLTCALALSCGDDAPPLEIDVERAECENLDPTHCLMPYPSMRFMREDATSESGFRVDIPIEAIPTNRMLAPVQNTSIWNRFDGFSPGTSLIAAFQGRVDQEASGLIFEERMEESLEPSSPTVLIDADTGEWVAHMSEIDEWSSGPPNQTTFYIRPATRLKEDHRYVVAIRGLVLTDGTPVEPSDYFRALRDDLRTDVDELEARRPRMETEVFGVLEGAGVAREDLILAWDFRTASGPSLYGEMLFMREDALRRFDEGTDGVGTCTVDRVDEDLEGDTFRRIRGTFTVPLYMEHEFEGALATRDGDGNVVYNRTAEAPFQIVIPQTVRTRVEEGRGPGRGLMYGHGLLGTASQVASGGTRAALTRSEMVGFGTDYWGLASGDEAQFLTHVVTQFDNFDQLGERLMQGTINSLLLQRAFAEGGQCAALPEMQLAVGDETRPLMNERELYYYGISQGGIMGATIAALSDTIDAYVLQVGAVGYSNMVRRSIDFVPFEIVFALWYTEKFDRDWFIVSTQSMWDLADPITYAGHILQDPLPGVDISNRRVLYQTSRWDAQVSNVTSDQAARLMGLPFFESSVYVPYGVEEGILESTSGPADSGYVIYELDTVEPIPTGTNIAQEDNDAHNDLRFLDPMLEQLELFCQPDGQVVDTCPDGSCRLMNTR